MRTRQITPEQAWDLYMLGHPAIYIGMPGPDYSNSLSCLHHRNWESKEEFLDQAAATYHIEEE